MAGDDHIHRGVQPLQNRHDVAVDARTLLPQHLGIGVAPFVDGDHDHIRALGAQLGHQGIGRGGLVFKTQAFHARRAHHGGRGLERHADEAHRHGGIALRETFDARSGQQRLAIFTHGVGGQKAELGPFKGLADLAGLAHREFLATALLQAQQLLPAPVKFVVAYCREVDLHVVHGFDGGLVQEQGRHQGRCTHHVPSGDHGMVRMPGLELRDGAGQVGGATGGHTLHPLLAADGYRNVGRLQVAVKIVEGDQPDIHKVGMSLRTRGMGAAQQRGQSEGCRQCGDRFASVFHDHSKLRSLRALCPTFQAHRQDNTLAAIAAQYTDAKPAASPKAPPANAPTTPGRP